MSLSDIPADFRDARPLDEARKHAITANRAHLLDRIIPDPTFVTELVEVGFITGPQESHLMNIVQPRDRNDKLLEFLARGSVANFDKFVQVLSRTQNDLVPRLTNRGEILSLCDCFMYNMQLY